MRITLALGLALVAAQPGHTAPAARDGVVTLLGHRLFPVLTSLDPATGGARVRAMLEERGRRAAACGGDAPCKITAEGWSEAEIGLAASMAGDRQAAARRELEGVNAILRIYGAGAQPRYPQIDGPDDTPDSAKFKIDVAASVAISDLDRGDPVTVLDPSIRLALALLDASNRLDAIAFEPLDGGDNAAPFKRSRTIDWARYPYTAMIVLGAGPEDRETPLSALSKLHVRIAAQRYFEGKAPFIIVSGGSVHPRRTHYVEAVEMRRALIERYHVPAEAIVLEPYARHTTTNLRNASRLLIAMHAPADRDALIITNPVHSHYVEGAEFAARNQKELGYQPGTMGKRSSPFDIAFRPSRASLAVDPLDPLDP